MLKTIQMTIDESLLRRLDEAVETLEMTRSAFIRQPVEEELRRQRILEMERRDNDICVASITTTQRAIPSQVFLGPDDGLPRDLAANLYYIQTVPKAKIGAFITELYQERMVELEVAIRFALGFSDVTA